MNTVLEREPRGGGSDLLQNGTLIGPDAKLNWNGITPQILVGSCPLSESDIARIRVETGATAFYSLQHDDCLAHYAIDYSAYARFGKASGLKMERCPIRDLDAADLCRKLPAAVLTLAGLVAGGHTVYVHCTAGTFRSMAIVLGYLVAVEGHSLESARALLSRRRRRTAAVWDACDQQLSAEFSRLAQSPLLH